MSHSPYVVNSGRRGRDSGAARKNWRGRFQAYRFGTKLESWWRGRDRMFLHRKSFARSSLSLQSTLGAKQHCRRRQLHLHLLHSSKSKPKAKEVVVIDDEFGDQEYIGEDEEDASGGGSDDEDLDFNDS